MPRAVALLSVPALVVGGLLLTAGPSVAETPPLAIGGLPDGGTVTIQTGFSGGSGKVTTVLLDEAGEAQTLPPQTVANNTCDSLSPLLSPGPAAITASGQACFRNLGFGVNPGRDGLSVFQEFLNPNTKAGEELSISAPDVPEGSDREYLFFGAVSLDIEALNVGEGADLQLTSYLGAQQVEQQDLDLTNRVVSWPPNYRVDTTLTQAADRIELTALGNTRFQLEGDTNNKQGSTFNLAQITDVVPCLGGEVALPNGGRLKVQGGEGCTDEPIVFDVNDEGELLLLKEPSEAEYTLVFPFETSTDPLARVEVDYDIDGEAPFGPVGDCKGSTTIPALAADANPLTGPADPDGIVAEADWDGFCEAGRTTTLDNDEWTVEVTLFGVNDPKFRFG